MDSSNLPPAADLAGDELALRALLCELDERGYDFTTVTPATHARILAREPGAKAKNLRDVFGWSLPFARELLDPPVWAALEDAGALIQKNDHWRSKLRVASLGGNLFFHSAYPTTAEDAVFFGPDTYRFARFIEATLSEGGAVRHLVDLGAGCGPGAIIAAGQVEAGEVSLIDLNPAALRLARANAAAAGVSLRTVEGDSLDAAEGPIDLVIANPPFIMDSHGREYRDGGEQLGAGISLSWAAAAAERLEVGGRMLLYTGSPIVDGEDALLAGLAEVADAGGCALRYEEIDPDIFGEELSEPAYRDARVERIAAVGAVLTKG
jgi:methylase of polypeptide subunit release factors